MILTDITFVHQRGKLFGVYWTTQSIASSCLAIASSYEAEALGWRGYYWIFAGLVAVGLILNFFLIPETRFFRPPATIDGQRVVTDAYGEQVVVDEKDSLAHADFSEGYGSASDKPLTFMETLKPWNGVSPNGTKLALTSYIAMAKCLTSPGMLWSVAYSGIILGTVIGFSLSMSHTLISGFELGTDDLSPFKSIRKRPDSRLWLQGVSNGSYTNYSHPCWSLGNVLYWPSHG